jgi:hypothetical protein
MRTFLFLAFLLVFLLPLSLLTSSCQHELSPFDGPDPIDSVPVDTTPIDTTPVDTTPVDTTPVDTTPVGNPCDPDKVYFEAQVLPLLRGNCAIPGCHDAITHQNDVILDSYANVMATADVEPFDLQGSKLFKVLIEIDGDKRMPKAPQPPLPPDQVNLIGKWILQGAQNLHCDTIDTNPCDLSNVSYSQFVKPTIQTNCQGCHSGQSASAGLNLTDYNVVKTVALNGRLHGAIAWLPGFKKMPFNSPNQLPACTIDKIKAWIDQGAPNN